MESEFKYKVVFSEMYRCFWVVSVLSENRSEVPRVETNGSFTAVAAEDLKRVECLIKELEQKGFSRDCELDELVKQKHKTKNYMV